MRAGESFKYQDVAAGTYGPFTVQGGLYQLDVIATFGGGDLYLEQLGPDQTTWLAKYVAPTSAPTSPVNTITASGSYQASLPPGQYRLVFTTGSAGYFTLCRVPTSE
jgi:hypothetical protein